MKKLNTLLGLALAATLATGCQSSSKSAESTSGAMVAHGDDGGGFRLRQFEEKTLPNGLRVLFIPDNTLPYISYSLLIKTGSAHDSAELSGLSSFVSDMLDKGTSKRSATQLANDLGSMGAEFDASTSYDYSIVSASAISTQAEPLLKTLIEIVTEPAFSDAEIERLRKQSLASIKRRVDNADGYADLSFSNFLYGDHGYGRPVTGTSKSVSQIKKRNIIVHYLKAYRPNNAILAVVGQYTPELKAKIEKDFSVWEKRETPDSGFGKIPDLAGMQFRLVDKADLVQAQIRMGHPGITRNDPDFLRLRVANTVLGGAFASRLNDRIRKDLGLTYSINSFFDARKDRGPFVVETFTKNASVGQTITEAQKVLAEFKKVGATSSEIDRAKGYLKGIFPASIETPEKLAFNLMLLRYYGIPDSYLTTYLQQIDNMSTREINEAINRHLDPSKMKVLVYSNAKEVTDQLKAISNGAEVQVQPAGLND